MHSHCFDIEEFLYDKHFFFNRNVYRQNVTEEQAPGIILRVLATDADEGQNAKVTYHLGNTSNDVTSRIRVDPHNGNVMSKVPLDRETFKVSEKSRSWY